MIIEIPRGYTFIKDNDIIIQGDVKNKVIELLNLEDQSVG